MPHGQVDTENLVCIGKQNSSDFPGRQAGCAAIDLKDRADREAPGGKA